MINAKLAQMVPAFNICKKYDVGSDRAFMQRYVDEIKEMFSEAKLKARQEEKNINQDREREILQLIK